MSAMSGMSGLSNASGNSSGSHNKSGGKIEFPSFGAPPDEKLKSRMSKDSKDMFKKSDTLQVPSQEFPVSPNRQPVQVEKKTESFTSDEEEDDDSDDENENDESMSSDDSNESFRYILSRYHEQAKNFVGKKNPFTAPHLNKPLRSPRANPNNKSAYYLKSYSYDIAANNRDEPRFVTFSKELDSLKDFEQVNRSIRKVSTIGEKYDEKDDFLSSISQVSRFSL